MIAMLLSSFGGVAQQTTRILKEARGSRGCQLDWSVGGAEKACC